MQSLLVVGGDKLGNITKKLEQEGFKEVIHLNGRNTRMTLERKYQGKSI